MTHELPPTIDPVAAARWAALSMPASAGPSGEAPASAWLHEEVARRMEERLAWIKLRPQQWAHWEAVRGGLQAHQLLAQRYPDAGCFVVESSPVRLQRARDVLSKPWWHPGRWKAAPTRFEAPPEGSLQMLWANMLLHQVADPQALIAHWHRTLAVDGFLMFSCFGPDTLRELRELYRALGWPAPAHEFTDMHDWGDMLVQAGFAEPVMDMERITLTFPRPSACCRNCANSGATCIRAALPGCVGAAGCSVCTRPWPPRRPATAHR
jgi:malonyl-CoA O-methyltransferase